MPPFASQLIAEFQQNKRLRMGIGLIGIILAIYLLLLLHDYRMQLRQNYEEEATRWVQLQGLTEQTQWLHRAAEANKLRQHLEATFWQADTKGLAQATLQKWLATEVERAQIKEPRLQVESTLDVVSYSNLWQVTARLDGIFNSISLELLLAAIAVQPRIFVVERLQIFNSGSRRFTLVVTAYFRHL